MTKTNANAIILFARDPVAGQVKTRLHPYLDQDTIFRLYLCFLNDSLGILGKVKNADRFAGVYPSSQSGFFPRLRTDASLAVFDQEGGDLGERMKNAFQERIKEGYRRVVIIGSDSPSLPAAHIEKALASDKDVVIGPSADGGYYLIGMGPKLVDVFAGVAWGSDAVLAQTLDRLRSTDCSLELLPPWYDVDRPEDLKFLKAHLGLMQYAGLDEAASTREFLMNLELD